MKPFSRITTHIRPSSTLLYQPALALPAARARLIPTAAVRTFHDAPARAADVAPILGAGPPPQPPVGAAEEAMARVKRRRKQAEMLKEAKELKGRTTGGLKKRFWREVSVKEVDGSLQVFLDQRVLRHPTTKQIVKIPASKPHLATALALEWDSMTSSLDATRQHLVPLTSIVCRALDIEAETPVAGAPRGQQRAAITETLMRYLDTDSVLCWAPEGDDWYKGADGRTLRDVQKAAAEDVVGFLVGRVWPGITIVPVLDGESIMPRSQDVGARAVVEGWVASLSAWELAGLERAVLASKSLLVAARLVAEWSDGDAGVRGAGEARGGKRFGVEEAARVASLEVSWQTGRWGEVEDTHDVEKEDMRRQLGSTVLLVAGTGS